MAVMTATGDEVAGADVEKVTGASAIVTSLAIAVAATGAAVDRRMRSHRICWWAS